MRFFTLIIQLLCITYFSGLSQEIEDWTGYIEIYNEKNVNTAKTEFSPAYWNDQIVFLKSKPRQSIFDKNTKEPFYDLYVSELNKVGFLTEAASFSNIINTTYHEGPCSFSKDGNEIFFTRVDYQGGTLKLNEDKVVTLKIYSSTFENGNWSTPQKISINEDKMASAHPAISYDQSFMVFASDREGGYGKMDLYISYRKNELWSEPQNLGAKINTSGNDWFPFLNERGYLFYSSDGKKDAKGLDVYVTENINTTWGPVLRLPAPLNSSHDDFGLIIDQSGTNGLLSSNRPGGQGKDDIYSYNSLVSLFSFYDRDYNLIRMNIKDQKTDLDMDNVLIRYKNLGDQNIEIFDKAIFEMGTNEIDSCYSNSIGQAKIELQEGYTLIEASYPGKENWQLVISNHGSKKNIEVKLKDETAVEIPEPKIVYIEKEVPTTTTIKNVKVDVGAVIVFENIYYDYNSFTLTTGAKTELNTLADLMLKNSNLIIQLSAHTDSRGEKIYNQELSQKRAQSAKDYLVSKGISARNITAIGFGETQLRNHCNDNVHCTEAEHIYNRRTEVKILDK